MVTRKGWASRDQVVSDAGIVVRIGGAGGDIAGSLTWNVEKDV